MDVSVLTRMCNTQGTVRDAFVQQGAGEAFSGAAASVDSLLTTLHGMHDELVEQSGVFEVCYHAHGSMCVGVSACVKCGTFRSPCPTLTPTRTRIRLTRIGDASSLGGPRWNHKSWTWCPSGSGNCL